MTDKQHAHALLDRIPNDQVIAAVRFLEFLLLDPVSRASATAPFEDEEVGEEEERAVARSKEWFEHNQGTPTEDVAAELGFTMEQIRDHKDPA
ncbi:hypothetical protein SBA4_2520009 [Candidatus Sulfopaludibacter sp. SbA4]|nr:hypothetical protein SBA4_2520009 [Candidatus Sulfopaludibacter sp. SbA4]